MTTQAPGGNPAEAPAQAAGAALGGSYEVIRQRLLERAAALGARADALNEARKKTFGGSEMALLGSDRVRTENNAIPRDLVSVRGKLVVGYHVFLGLRAEPGVADLFTAHRFQRAAAGLELADLPLAVPPGGEPDPQIAFLLDPTFEKELRELHRYVKDVRLLQLRRTETRLLAVFQTGATLRDLKVFRWSIDAAGRITYLDSRGDEDHVRPRAHDFSWKTCGREDHVAGKFPHVSIEDQVFVETTGGDLTIKLENNTASGEGVLAEPVDDPNQSLDDAEIHYARVGSLFLLKIKPFREPAYRYFVVSPRHHVAERIDSVGLACLQLPEDQGVVFPDGYFLATGERKRFEGNLGDVVFERAVKSPNGEDVLYVFHRILDGTYLLLSYNLIRKEVASPITCHGYSLFDDGTMIVLRAMAEATRVHPLQIWRTPFTTAEYAASAPTDGSYLAKVGNPELVRGVSDAYSLRRLAAADAPTRATFEETVRLATRMLDSYYWLGHAEAGDVASVVRTVRETAEAIIDEFDKVEALRVRARKALDDARSTQKQLLGGLRAADLASVDAFMSALTAMRRHRGHLHTLRELKFMDLAEVDRLEAETVERYGETSRAAVEFLLRPDALAPLLSRLDAIVAEATKAGKSSEVAPLAKQVDEVGDGLGVLTEIGAGLVVDDPTIRTRILESVSESMAQLNRARAVVSARSKDLRSAEGRTEFGVQFKLFGQSVASAISVCDTPERCDQELSKILVQLEELEGRFGELEEFLPELAAKREEVNDAFGGKRQSLLDERQKRVSAVLGAADRILSGVARRARQMKSQDEVATYFSSDPMIAKVRDLAEQLRALGDAVKADELESRTKAARQDAVRALRDREELSEGGEGFVKFGRHRFSVNTQALELTIVPRDGELAVHLSGTDFYERIVDPALEASRDLWGEELPSESAAVYRGEYLAFLALDAAENGQAGLSLDALTQAAVSEGGLLAAVRAFAAERHDEGYERGVHDVDAAAILEKLLAARKTAGLLRFESPARALATLAWADLDEGQRSILSRRGRSLARLKDKLADSPAREILARDLEPVLRKAAEALHLSTNDVEVAVGARYLVEELSRERVRFQTSQDALALRDAFVQQLELLGARSPFEDDLRQLERHGPERLALALAWLEGFVARSGRPDGHLVREAAAVLVTERKVERDPSAAVLDVVVPGLLGQHPRIVERALRFRFDEALTRLGDFARVRVPRFRAYRRLRVEIGERERHRLRLSEFTPRVLTSFVRNRLIDEVYLPLVGNNLAKQLGAAGATKRTDLMGLLLLVSPPGYGKTTLMEYVASKLGLVFMKVNGPSLGHDVKSLDPREAPNATARQEVEKINLALEMGNNVMLYLDDIQHTHPELLQKFISLCDAQRRIEGVWNGRSRTYDLRGKRFCVCMAGNPYTETGAKFSIPDMLANRADTYNLGDILEGKDEVFALSYLENALTSNAVLAPLAGRSPNDVRKLVRMAQGDAAAGDLEHPYSASETTEIVEVIRRLLAVQRTILSVNLEYIRSAAQDDAYRTEPPFKLQGSYRNMNKLAEKVVAAHTPDEIERLVDDHYAGESQTLTTGAEQNLLKLAELRGRLSPEQRARWDEIKRTYARQKKVGGKDDDPIVRVTGTLASLGEELGGIKEAVVAAIPETSAAEDLAKHLGPRLATLEAALREVGRPKLEVSLPAGEGTAQVLAERLHRVEDALAPVARAASEGGALARTLEGTLEKLSSVLDALREQLSKGLPVAAVAGPGVAAPFAAPAPQHAAPPPASSMAAAQDFGPAAWLAGGPAGSARRPTPPPLPTDAPTLLAVAPGAPSGRPPTNPPPLPTSAFQEAPRRPPTNPPGATRPPTNPPPAPQPAPRGDLPMLVFEAELGPATPTNFYRTNRNQLDVVEYGGVFVSTFRKLPTEGVAVRVALLFPGGARFESYAVVTFVREAELGKPDVPPGFGARLVGLGPEQRALVQRFVMHRDPDLVEL